MSMTINQSIDIEDAVREVLSPHLTAYCAPLPADFATPSILVQMVGGGTEHNSAGRGKMDSFTVVLDARAKTEEDASNYLRYAVAILEATHESGISYVEVNSLYSWGTDPVRPDLAMCSATLVIRAHRETITID